MLFFYFIIISFSLIGYGYVTSRGLGIKTFNIGEFGILGIILLSLISFTSSILFKHNYVFNLFFLILGIIFFLIYLKNVDLKKNDVIKVIVVFSVLLIFILVGKNHDDFAYYHFGYSIFLTEFSHPIGFGKYNNGFRSPSSIFFLNSMFYLPKISFYSFNLVQALILAFSNLIFFDLIFNKKFFKNKSIICFLSLITFLFINIFFYRLAEHGTDRSGMILILICLLYFLILTNNFKEQEYYNDYNHILKLFVIFLCFVATIKPFYLIYLSMILLLFFYKDMRFDILKLIMTRTFLLCISILALSIFYTFINSGCLIFPLEITCFYNLDWSLDKKTIENVNSWFELWSKAGAGPGYASSNKLQYIENFNWFANWVDKYFFNKVFDFLLGTAFLSFIVFFSFRNKNDKIKKNINFYPILILTIILFLEWFLKHPALRYGGYHIIAMLVFLPFSVYLSKFNISKEEFFKKSKILIMIALTIFVTRNINRLNNEFDRYNYNPLVDTNYKFIGGDKKFHFRFSEMMKRNITNYNYLEFLGKKIYILK